MTVFWEGGIEIPSILSVPLVAARLLVLTVIGVLVIRAKADQGGEMGMGKLTMLGAHQALVTNYHRLGRLTTKFIVSQFWRPEFNHGGRADSA